MTQSIAALKASSGSGNASTATVQNLRNALATSIIVDTVAGWPTSFYATMGTPHTFVDPVTSETITVISDDTAVDFRGHIDTGHIEIDTIAPGYTDNGSAVGDIVVIRPTTQWADDLAAVLGTSLKDDGTFKDDSITSNAPFVDAVDPVKRATEMFSDYVASGCVWTGDSIGSTRNGSMTAGVIYINGKRLTVALVTAHAFTASKDTYVDVVDSGSGTGTISYNETTNGGTPPALAANSIRLAKIVTGASSIAATSSIVQTGIDTLNNWIYPVDPFGRNSWKSWTPTLTSITLGNGTLVARYTKEGKTVRGYLMLTAGSTTSWTGVSKFTVPVAAAAAYATSVNVFGWIGGLLQNDVSTGTIYTGTCALVGSTTVANVYGVGGTSGGQLSGTIGVGLGTGDVVFVAFEYEAA